MAFPLFLIKNLAKKGTRSKAKKKLKATAAKKEKSLISKGKPEENQENQENKKLKITSTTEETKKLKSSTFASDIEIKSAPSTEDPIVQLKMNVTNIHTFLKKQNKNSKKLQKNEKRINVENESRKKLSREENSLKLESPIKKSSKSVKKFKISNGNMFNDLFEFMGLILLGIAVNALPTIVEVIQNAVNTVFNFLEPIRSGFNTIKSYFMGNVEPHKKDYEKNKEHIDNANKENENIPNRLENIFGFATPIIDKLKEWLPGLQAEEGFKTPSMSLAKKDGEEGYLDHETKMFYTPQQLLARIIEENKDEEHSKDALTELEEHFDRSGWTEEERDIWESGGGNNISFIPQQNIPSSSGTEDGATSRYSTVTLSGDAARLIGNDTEFLKEITRLCKKYDISEGDLLGKMASESGFNPAEDNGTHVGLIQFSRDSARAVGTTQAALKKMTRVQQMKYVEKYFDYWKLRKGASAGHLYTVTYLPAFAKEASDYVLATKDGFTDAKGRYHPAEWYHDNEGLDMNGDGKITIAELSDRIRKKKKEFGIKDNAPRQKTKTPQTPVAPKVKQQNLPEVQANPNVSTVHVIEPHTTIETVPVPVPIPKQ
jgi:thymidylate synthase|tara:strand:- start:5327 stop:7129 length:1803 start_codon:yes stop_codon:yes gene_type:complete